MILALTEAAKAALERIGDFITQDYEAILFPEG